MFFLHVCFTCVFFVREYSNHIYIYMSMVYTVIDVYLAIMEH